MRFRPAASLRELIAELAEYKIVRVLGAGGFGITYLAFDRKLAGPVALKEYFPHGHAARAGDRVAATSTGSRELFSWGLARFLDEAWSIHRLRHPNVVRVHRYLETDGTAYIVMEHVEGEPLEAILEARAQLPAAEWRRPAELLRLAATPLPAGKADDAARESGQHTVRHTGDLPAGPVRRDPRTGDAIAD